MNDKTTQLIETLAAKLGTTAEYLWSVLIKQAAISATGNLVGIMLLALGVTIYVKWLTRKLKDEDFYWDDEFGTQAIAIMLGVISLTLSIVSVAKTIPSIITGYMNPEYWALQQILEKI